MPPTRTRAIVGTASFHLPIETSPNNVYVCEAELGRTFLVNRQHGQFRSGRTKETGKMEHHWVSFGEDSGPLVLQRGGIRVRFDSSGVNVYTGLPVVMHPAANDSGAVSHQLTTCTHALSNGQTGGHEK